MLSLYLYPPGLASFNESFADMKCCSTCKKNLPRESFSKKQWLQSSSKQENSLHKMCSRRRRSNHGEKEEQRYTRCRISEFRTIQYITSRPQATSSDRKDSWKDRTQFQANWQGHEGTLGCTRI